jgi:hypothetical protein
MTPTQRTAQRPTVRVAGAHPPGPPETPPTRSSIGRTIAVGLLLVSVMLVAAGAGYLLAGGRLPSERPAPTPDAAAVAKPAGEPAATPVQATATAPPAPTAAPTPENRPTPSAVPAVAAQEPAAAPPTPALPTPVPPIQAPAAKPANPPASEPTAAASASRPGTDPRRAEIERRIQGYFAALGAGDYARAQAVCCTPAWRARYPLERWQHNFDGVTDLRLVGAPRYLRVEDDLVVVDTDYTFISGGARRNFTLRWTFTPVGSEWQADLAEAFPT